jgi:hypothetical protein
MIAVCVISNTLKRKYTTSYEFHICIGEIIRNCCVNIGIDPDTVDGVTKNILVYRVEQNNNNEPLIWHYNPTMKLCDCSSTDCVLSIFIEPV